MSDEKQVIDLVSDDDEDVMILINEKAMCCHPGCHRWISLDEIDSHELAHKLSADDNAESAEAGRQAAAAMQEEEEFRQLQLRYGFSSEPIARQGRCFTCGQEGHWSGDSICPSKPKPLSHSGSASLLLSSQVPDQQYTRIMDECQPLIPLLVKTLSEQKAPPRKDSEYKAYLSGPVVLMAGQVEDRGWGCGYRNIQMLASHLLNKEGAVEAKKALFGGCNFVPDVRSIQAWLEVSWNDGFDPPGCESLGGAVQGSSKWIGTTEACSIFRFFGLHAEIIDFKSKSSSYGQLPGTRFYRRGDGKAVHPGVECDLCGVCPIIGERHHSRSKANYDVCPGCLSKAQSGNYEIIGKDHEDGSSTSNAVGGTGGGTGGGGSEGGGLAIKLMERVWEYFIGAGGSASGDSPQKVTVTHLPPIYFQHDGHSRTIVGIERRSVVNEVRKTTAVEAAAHLFGGPSAWGQSKTRTQVDHEYTLLILDPGLGHQRALEDALVSGRGWQRFLRRSAETLRHNEFQLMFVRDELKGERERQGSRKITCKELIQADY